MQNNNNDLITAFNRSIVIIALGFIGWFFVVDVLVYFWWGRLTGPLAFIGGFILLGALGYLLLQGLNRLPDKSLLVLLLFVPVVFRLLLPAVGAIGAAFMVMVALLSLTLLLIGLSRWGLMLSSNVTIVSVSVITMVLTWLITGLTRQSDSLNPLLDDYQLVDQTLPLANPAKPGDYQVGHLTYGSGKDLRRAEYGRQVAWSSEAVDGGPLAEQWQGFGGKLRTWYWGFDGQNLPLNAHVWYPQADGRFPLILMVHGNHSMENSSEQGYEYLGRLLASRGYIFVSVDENFLNDSFAAGMYSLQWGLKRENDLRAWLLLQHLQQWRLWQGDHRHRLHQQVDLKQTLLIGHSRGGEAVLTAGLFNQLSHYPDDASIEFDFGFDLAGIIAIAPADGQYRPRGQLVSLLDTNYFTLQGSFDGDAQSFMGSSAYSRIQFDDSSFHFKASAYAYGANHSQFNTLWGRCDAQLANCWSMDLAQVMPAQPQREIAKVYISAFADVVTGRNKGYLPLFKAARFGQNWLPKRYYISNYADSEHITLANFEEDLDVATGSLAQISTLNLTGWKEVMVKLKWMALDSYAAQLSWDHQSQGVGHYMLDLKPNHLVLDHSSQLVFSLATKDMAMSRAAVDFSLVLTDSAGVQARLPLSHVHPLYPQVRFKPKWASFLNNTGLSEPVMGYFNFKLGDFVTVNEAFNPAALSKITLVFDKTEQGTILLDDIALVQ